MVKKVVRRSIFKDKIIFISINIMIFITVLLSVLSFLSFDIGYQSFQTYKEEVNLEDFQMRTFEKLTDNDIDYIQNKYEIELQEDNKYVYKDEDAQISIYEYEQNEISDIKILKGSKELSDEQIIISNSYAMENDLDINDTIEVNGKVLIITGLSLAPEDIYPVKDGGLFPENDKVAIGFTNENTFEEVTEPSEVTTIYRGKFKEAPANKTDVYENIKADLEIETVKTNIINEVSQPIEDIQRSNVISLTDYSKNFNIGMLELEFKFVSIIMLGMSLLIGIITVVLSLFLFKSVVEKQRREIGILRAFGIYQTEIMNGYSRIFAISITITSILAVILGLIAYNGLNNLYSQFFNFITYPVSFLSYALILVIVGIEALILILCVRYVSIKKNLSNTVLNMIQNVEDKNTKIKKAKFKFRKFKTNIKFRIVTRNFAKTMLLIYGILFSTFLLVFALSMVTAVRNMQDNIFGDEFSYQYEAIFTPGFKTDKDLYNEQSIIYFAAEVDNEEENNPISVIGYDVANPYININNDKTLIANEVYISSLLADNYKLKVGDTLVVNNPSNQEETYEFKVKEVTSNKAEEKVYVNINYLHKIFDLNDKYYNGYVGKGKTKKELDQGDSSFVYYSAEDIVTGINSYSKLVNVVITGLSVFAFIISLIALGVITNIIIKNNEKVISIMKVLGYETKEINSFIISGYRPIVIISFLIAFPLSGIGAQYYMKFILSLVEDINYPLVLEPTLGIFIISFAIIMLSFEIALILTRGKINKVSLAKALNIDE